MRLTNCTPRQQQGTTMNCRWTTAGKGNSRRAQGPRRNNRQAGGHKHSSDQG
ncbi:hypothetical protein TSUD_127370 [Trifolium subterraneum]|nr:hypothetical protein TSUD_127370 [Trifolium subterraneum]